MPLHTKMCWPAQNWRPLCGEFCCSYAAPARECISHGMYHLLPLMTIIEAKFCYLPQAAWSFPTNMIVTHQHDLLPPTWTATAIATVPIQNFTSSASREFDGKLALTHWTDQEIHYICCIFKFRSVQWVGNLMGNSSWLTELTKLSIVMYFHLKTKNKSILTGRLGQPSGPTSLRSSESLKVWKNLKTLRTILDMFL